MKIGTLELVVIFVVALIVLGPEKMPYYTKKLGQALGQLKGYSNKLAEDIRENIVDPLDETTAPLKDAVEPLTSLKKEIEQPIKEVEKSIKSVGKPKPSVKEAPQAESTNEMPENSASQQNGVVAALKEKGYSDAQIQEILALTENKQKTETTQEAVQNESAEESKKGE